MGSPQDKLALILSKPDPQPSYSLHHGNAYTGPGSDAAYSHPLFGTGMRSGLPATADQPQQYPHHQHYLYGNGDYTHPYGKLSPGTHRGSIGRNAAGATFYMAGGWVCSR